MANPDVFDAYFRKADVDQDGKISGQEAVAFFQGSNLPNDILAKIWQYADRGQTGSLSRAEFYNALKLVTVAQTGRQLTPDIVRAALVGPASAQIPPPRIAPLNQPQPPPFNQPQQYRPPASIPAGVSQQLYPHGRGSNHLSRPPIPPGPSLQRPTIPISGASPPVTKALVPGQTTVPPVSTVSQSAANSFPSQQLPIDAFVGSAIQAGAGTNGVKITPSGGPVSPLDSVFGGDVFTATPVQATGGISSESVPVKPSETALGLSDLGSRALVNASLSPAIASKQPQPVVQQSIPVNIHGPSLVATTGLTAGGQWNKMSHSDVQRYTKVFMEVDTDRDGKITGDQARELFLSWRLPREALKQIWDLSDQDHDGMLSLREFCMALYFMERFREGRTLPSGFSPGVLLEESAVAALRIAEAQAAIVQHSAGINVPTWQKNPGILQHPGQSMPVSTVRPSAHSYAPVQRTQTHTSDGVNAVGLGQTKSMAPTLEENFVAQLNQDEQQTLRTKHKEAEEAGKKVQELEKEIMDSKEKTEFYRTKLQEIILFKTRCDNRLTEITERAAADKREVEALAKRYDEKFKQAGDSLSRLLAEEAVFRDIQERRLELYNALVKMDQGGDSNSLLQSRADRMYTDLDELRKELNEKCKRMGLRSKPSALIELPYGWQPGLQENAIEWDDDWDKFDDEGFSIVHDLLDEVTAGSVMAKSTVTASWDDNSLQEEGLDISSGSTDNKERVEGLKAEPGQLEVGSSKAESENSSMRDENESPHHEISVASPDRGRKTVTENSNVTSKESHSNEQAPASSNTQDLFGDSATWASAFDVNTDEGDVDVRASWGVQGSPTRTKAFSSNAADTASSFGFGDPFDMLSGSAKGQENDLHDEFHRFGPIRTREQSSIFFDSSVPSTPLFNTTSPGRGSSSGAFDEHISGRDYFARFDSFSSNRDGGQSTTQDSFTRFDSFSSVRDASHTRGFTSFDESDPFAGTGPFAASRQISKNSTDTWNAFS